MSEPVHAALWRRMTKALGERNALTPGSPGDIAAHARAVLATDVVERFVRDYYQERQWGGGAGRLSDAAAEQLVRELEALQRSAAPAAVRAPARAAGPLPIVVSAAGAGPGFLVQVDLEEAEAYGEEGPAGFSPLGALRHFFLDLRDKYHAWQEERRKRLREEEQRKEAERLAKLDAAFKEEARRKREEAQRKAQEAEAAAARQRQIEDEKRRKEREEADRAAKAVADAAERARLIEEERKRREREDAARKAQAEKEAAERARQAEEERNRRDSEEQARRDKLKRDEAERAAAAARHLRDLSARAAQFGKEGDARGAIEALEELVELQPKDAMGWFRLAWYFAKQGNYRRATRCYESGLRLQPDNKIAWNNLGHGLRRIGRYKPAAAALRKSIELDPGYATAWSNLGTTLKDKREYAEAAKAFAEAVRLKPADGAGWYWLGVCLQQVNDQKGALPALQRATEINAQNWDGWARLGDCLQKLGRRKEAQAAYAKAEGLTPPPSPLGAEAYIAAALAMGASFGATRSAWIGVVAVLAFAVLTWNLRPRRAQLFFILVPALPLLATQFGEAPAGAVISMAILLVWAGIVGKVWRRPKR